MRKLAVLGVLLLAQVLGPPAMDVLQTDAANTLALRGGDPKEWRLYSTYTDVMHHAWVEMRPVAAHAQETVTLTTPQSFTSLTAYHTERMTIDFDAGTILIQLKGNQGAALSCVYGPTTSPTGTFLINGLNKADLSSAYAGNASTGSLKQRINHRLVVMGEAASVCGQALTGTLTGTVP